MAMRAWAVSTRVAAWNGTCSSVRRTTCRWPTPPRRPTISTCSAVRCCVPSEAAGGLHAKKLLRYPDAVSTMADLAEGKFQAVIDDPQRGGSGRWREARGALLRQVLLRPARRAQEARAGREMDSIAWSAWSSSTRSRPPSWGRSSTATRAPPSAGHRKSRPTWAPWPTSTGSDRV